MGTYSFGLLAEVTAFEIYLYRTKELSLRVVLTSTRDGKRALHDCLLEWPASCQSGITAPSNHRDPIERFHACSWVFVAPHLRDQVQLLLAFIERTRTRVGHAMSLASLIPDLMDHQTLRESKEFLELSHVTTPPWQPTLPPKLGDKSIVAAANALFTKSAYKLLQKSEYDLYFSCTGTMIERVLVSMCTMTPQLAAPRSSTRAGNKSNMGLLIAI